MHNIVFVDSVTYDGNHIEGNENINIGLHSLATVLNQYEGYSAKVVNFNQLFFEKVVDLVDSFDENINNMCKYILNLKPDVVSFYTLYNSHYIALTICKRLRELNKHVTILLGGPHASIVAKETLERFDFIDGIGIGEGEETIKGIIDALINHERFDDVPGLAFKEGGHVKINETETISNLDQLPMIDYGKISNIKKRRDIPLDIGRGCPFNCTFCSTKTFWKRQHRLKSPERIVNEIEYIVNNFGIKYFNFVHDHFTFDKSKVIDFCDLLIERNLNITFECSSRADTVDEEIVKKLSRAGCTTILLGIETGSSRMQKLIKKNLDINRIYDVINLLKKYNINIVTSFIIGFPEETMEDIKETFNMIHYLGVKKIRRIFCNKLEILPGTELFNQYKNHLILRNSTQKTVFGYSYGIDTEIKGPEFLPGFFEYKTKIRDELSLVPTIISFFYETLYKQFNLCYRYIIHYFNDDLLEFLFDFRDKNYNSILNLFDEKFNEAILDKSIQVKLIKNYVETNSFGEYEPLIKEIFRLEYGIYTFSNKKEEKEEVISFNIDILKFLKENTTKNIFYPQKIRLLKKDKNTIRIEPVEVGMKVI